MWLSALPACLALAAWLLLRNRGNTSLEGAALLATWVLAGGAVYYSLSQGHGMGPLLLVGVLAALAVWLLGLLLSDPGLSSTGFGWSWPVALVLLLRTFVYEPYQIPSASMEPGLVQGDFILVNRFALGLRPVEFGARTWFASPPQRGDVLVFRSPEDGATTLIKRVVGVPGDRVEYRRGKLRVNGADVPCPWLQPDGDDGPSVCAERLPGPGGEHLVRYLTRRPVPRPGDDVWQVPPGRYMVLGDNRDNSRDSRFWGELLPEGLILGRADHIWMHWPSFTTLPRFQLRAIE